MNKLGYPPKICKIAVLSNVASLYFFQVSSQCQLFSIRFVPVALSRKKTNSPPISKLAGYYPLEDSTDKGLYLLVEYTPFRLRRNIAARLAPFIAIFLLGYIRKVCALRNQSQKAVILTTLLRLCRYGANPTFWTVCAKAFVHTPILSR